MDADIASFSSRNGGGTGRAALRDPAGAGDEVGGSDGGNSRVRRRASAQDHVQADARRSEGAGGLDRQAVSCVLLSEATFFLDPALGDYVGWRFAPVACASGECRSNA